MTTTTLPPTTLPEPDPRDVLLRELAQRLDDFGDTFEHLNRTEDALDCWELARRARRLGTKHA